MKTILFFAVNSKLDMGDSRQHFKKFDESEVGVLFVTLHGAYVGLSFIVSLIILVYVLLNNGHFAHAETVDGIFLV